MSEDKKISNTGQKDEKASTSDSSLAKTKIIAKVEQSLAEQEQQESQAIQEIDQLAADLLTAAEVMTRKTETSSLKRNIQELSDAIQTLKTASVLNLSNKVIPQEVEKINPYPAENPCGCNEPVKKHCCMQLKCTGIRVLKTGDLIGPRLELILAVAAAGTKSVFPSLLSPITVDKNNGWTKVNWDITRICVPCDQSKSIPISIEMMERDYGINGAPETGSLSGLSLPLNCTCDVIPQVYEINIEGGGLLERRGVILVEITAERVDGACCC